MNNGTIAAFATAVPRRDAAQWAGGGGSAPPPAAYRPAAAGPPVIDR